MSSIAEIPLELLDHILKLVDNPIAQMSVCRKFNDVATPIAYRHIQLKYCKNAVIPADIHLLLRTVIGRPALASHTRFLCFQSPPFDPAPPYLDDFPNFAAAAAARGLPQEVQLGLEKGSIEAMFLLLLSYLPVLQALHIEDLDVEGIFAHHLSSATKLHSGLQSLRLLVFNHTNSYGEDCITPLLCLPALHTLSCYGGCLECTIFDTELPPGSSSVEQILLEYSEWDDGPLATLIRSSQALRCLRYRSNIPGVLGSFYMSSTWNALLERAKHTLERLDLLFPDKDPVGPVGSPGSLHDFTRLTHLYATLTILIGPPHGDNPIPSSMILPESLVFLAVWVEEMWWSGAGQLLIQLLGSTHDYFRQLKEFRVGGDIEGAELEVVRSVCLADGVEFGEFETAFSEDGVAVLDTDKFTEVPCFHEI